MASGNQPESEPLRLNKEPNNNNQDRNKSTKNPTKRLSERSERITLLCFITVTAVTLMVVAITVVGTIYISNLQDGVYGLHSQFAELKEPDFHRLNVSSNLYVTKLRP